MARRYPVERHIRVKSVAQAGQTGSLVRISDEMSKLNHRLYRQGMVYDATVSLDPDYAGVVDVYVLQDTWMHNEAWKLAFKKFLENNDHDGIRKSRWNDFRVHPGVDPIIYTQGRAAAAAAGQGVTITENGNYGAGEFVNSQVTTTSGNQLEFAWSITGAGQYNMLLEYDRHGNTDADPESVITTTPYEGLNDDTENAQYEHMQDAGNEPPYNADGGLGDCWMKVATLRADSTNATRLSASIKALCGFVLLVGYYETSDPKATVLVKPGSYKGISAEPIGVAKRLPAKGGFKVV